MTLGKSHALTNFPKPSNPTTTIRGALACPGNVTFAVGNIFGPRLRRLVNETRCTGEHAVTWDGRRDVGLRASTGVSFTGREARLAGGDGRARTPGAEEDDYP